MVSSQPYIPSKPKVSTTSSLSGMMIFVMILLLGGLFGLGWYFGKKNVSSEGSNTTCSPQSLTPCPSVPEESVDCPICNSETGTCPTCPRCLSDGTCSPCSIPGTCSPIPSFTPCPVTTTPSTSTPTPNFVMLYMRSQDKCVDVGKWSDSTLKGTNFCGDPNNSAQLFELIKSPTDNSVFQIRNKRDNKCLNAPLPASGSTSSTWNWQTCLNSSDSSYEDQLFKYNNYYATGFAPLRTAIQKYSSTTTNTNCFDTGNFSYNSSCSSNNTNGNQQVVFDYRK